MCSKVSELIGYVLFEYDTPKIVHIKSKTVGVINRIIQLLIISYIIGYVIIYNKGYQEFSSLQSSVTTKVKGAVYSGHELLPGEVPHPEVYERIWDVADYIVPPQENGAFFVMTNAIITPNQSRTKNATFPVVNKTICDPVHPEKVCVKGTITAGENGVMTGKCVLYMVNESIYTCEAYAWFPLEIDSLPKPYNTQPLLKGTENFTVLIKNSVSFSTWPYIKTRNIVKDITNKSYLQSCNYDNESDPLCPIFRLGTIVKQANENYTNIATHGGVIGILINWECNLDFKISNCKPQYTFRRLDDPDSLIAPGWNFRYAHDYSDSLRTLYKAYGILFVVIVEGRGGKFNIVPLMLNVGSGLALLSIAVVLCDIIVLYLMRKRQHYRESKYQIVNDSDLSGLLGNDQLQDSCQYNPGYESVKY